VTIRIRVRPEAEADIADAYSWYEESRPGLGEGFLEAVRESLRSVQTHSEGYAVVHADIRRVLLRRFPYGLFYYLARDEIVVLGCLHARRDPKTWQARGRRRGEA
jgi:plasmid stabilization system protein ParE